ncbi:MAG: DEAD/DEAH box helicase [Myxococcota bacterium]|nr:DEAD/DEAH box helicase [Myxococcota bacterium]
MSQNEILQGQLQSTKNITLPSGKTITKGVLGTIEGQQHTCLWWDAADAPQEGSQLILMGNWKSYRDELEFHVTQTRCQTDHAFSSLLRYYQDLKRMEGDWEEVYVLEGGTAPGFYAHPEPKVPIEVPAHIEDALLHGQGLHIGWPLIRVEGRLHPLFYVAAKYSTEEGLWPNGEIRYHEAGLISLGVSAEVRDKLTYQYRSLGWTGIEKLNTLLGILEEQKRLDSKGLNPKDLHANPDARVQNCALLFRIPPYNKEEFALLQLQSEAALRSSSLGYYFGLRDPRPDQNTMVFPAVVPLNWEQHLSVCSSLSKELTVVTGPPGTGKSQVLISAAVAAVLNGERVLIAAANNQAVDLVINKIERDCPIALPIRLGRKELRKEMADKIFKWKEMEKPRTQIPLEIPPKKVDAAVRGLYRKELSLSERQRMIKKISPIRESWGRYLWERYWRKLDIHTGLVDGLNGKAKISRTLANCGASLFGVTIKSAPNVLPWEQGFFDLLIIDEASQCTPADVIPLLWRAKRLLIIGDIKQLPPIFNISKETERSLSKERDIRLRGYTSLFAQAAQRSSPLLLREHYRSRPEIISVSNHLFYGSKLIEMRRPKRGAILWYDVSVSGSLKGTQNMDEAQFIADVRGRNKDKWQSRGYSIGIVTPFRDQVGLLRQTVNDDDVLIDTAHRFQGEERDIMFYSLVLHGGSPPNLWSFAQDRPLLNVALTRAKERLIIVGDKEACKGNGGVLAEMLQFLDGSE